MPEFDIRGWLERREETLSPLAARSKLSHRDRPEEPSPIRTEIQRDRDRIVHSKAFRRLKHKTQVFITPLSDHYVTRLTHTLEVSQIARTIVRALNLNVVLAEAISLGHDLGHTPFGHVGEDVLNEVYPDGFRHNEQSLRVVELLEKEGKGLNLTLQVREGILKHSKSREGILGQNWNTPETLEGQVCKISDSIAYVNHDIGDAIRANLITAADLPQSAISVLGATHSARINTLVGDVIDYSWEVAGWDKTPSSPTIGLSPRVLEAMNILRDFLFERVYDAVSLRDETERARKVVGCLYRYFVANPDKLAREFPIPASPAERAVVDYIASMTDQYALRMAAKVMA